MTQFLPPNLLALFAPRDPIPFLPQIERHKYHRKLPYTGVAQFLSEFEEPSETPPKTKIETREERKERKNYDTGEGKLRREFEVYGAIKQIKLIKDKFSSKPLGYGFIEFENERDMQTAQKDANGRKVDGHRILTDVERGRTRPDWRPRRLGKGLGKCRDGPGDRDKRERDREPDRERRERFPDKNRERDRDRRRKTRSRSPQHKDRDRRKRSRSRDKDRRRRSRSRDYKRRDRYRDDMISQYGEYGHEIRAEYNGDM